MVSLAVGQAQVNAFGVLERIRRQISPRTLVLMLDKIFTGKTQDFSLTWTCLMVSMMMKALLGEWHSTYEDDK
ncbi:hypothetical protein [Streptomyces virginiae]